VTLSRDLRFGFRILTRNPSYAVAAVLVAALGVGSTTAVFSVVRGVLLQPLPYRDVDRLVTFRTDAPGFRHTPAISDAEFRALRELHDVFDDLATANNSEASLTGVDDMERVRSASISDNFLPTFGVAPAYGRLVNARDDVGPQWVRGVDISYELWQRRWRGDPGILGRTIEVNNLPMHVVGVMPRGFRLYFADGSGVAPQVDVWYPGAPDNGTGRACPAVARLRDGVSVAAAQVAVDAFMKRFASDHRASYRTGAVRLSLTPLADDVVGGVRPAIVALAAAVGFVLLVACANLTNLLLARATARTRELAVRTAIGATRRQLVQQLAVESLVIAALGAAAGILVAEWARDALVALAPATLPRRENIVIDGTVLAFAAGTAACSALLFGLVPAWHATRRDLIAMIKPDASSARHAGRTRGLLVASQLALSLALLVGAGLMARSFVRMRQVPLGFNPANVMTMKMDLPPMRFKTSEQRQAFLDAALAAAGQVPGVDAIALGTPLPFDAGGGITLRYALGPGEPEGVVSAVVDHHRFAEFLGVPLRAGRYLADGDRAREVPAIMVDDRFAATIWPGQDPVGKRLLLSPGSKSSAWAEVVGIVAHVQLEDPRRHEAPQIWVTHRTLAYDPDVVFRTRRDPRAVALDVKKAIEQLGPGRPLFDLQTLDRYVEDASVDARFALTVLAAFAVLAVLLTAIGIYGAVAYATARRTREIAVRIALGANGGRVVALVMRDGAWWIGSGLLAGGLAARLMTQYATSLLFGVTPGDAATYAAVAGLLAAVALAATAVPAIRAVRTDPMLALRTD
jgi:putative ABC transport system permease protein